MKNTKEMRHELTKIFQDVKENKISAEDAEVLIRTSNAILKSCALELQQNKFLEKKNTVDFLTVNP